ncbi:HEAT repeat domain-containing protein [Scytonema millei VB511283]|uniref:HEAT repeat domain-containing protein n=1 Tax=Scytonema millei VB511283 TaxID=1245923 RepID=A0A9X5E7F3_9CYAN|nr:HEAT repeat domain-containing protein [Scytonema millei VB511283]
MGQIDRALENLIEQFRASVTPAEAIASIVAIASYHTPDAIPPLIEALSHHHPGVRAVATSQLVQLASLSLEALISTYYTATDQGVQAHIIQALAQIGDCQAIAVLEEVVGVSVNHCQGNVRRIAATGLGKIGSTAIDAQIIHRAVNKLSWALLSPEDWGLRYAAALSLAEIGTQEAIAVLQQALTQESDRVVQTRIRMALAG